MTMPIDIGIFDEQAQLREAVQLAKTGKRKEALDLLAAVCSLNRDNEMAWLWRASLADTPAEGLSCLSEVLRINPNNATAESWVTKMGGASQAKSLLCPICGGAITKTTTGCPKCGALLRLYEPSRFASNDELRKKYLVAAEERYLRQPA
jgi:rRNA maturation protein Nop10